MKTRMTRDNAHYSELKVMQSAAGWYVGTTYDHLAGDQVTVEWYEPGSRDSGYFATEAEAKFALMREGDTAPVSVTTPAELFRYMAASTSREDWGHRCIKVKAEHGGDYPQFWFQTCIKSGLLMSLQNRW